MICPKCGFDTTETRECPRCGVLFHKCGPRRPEEPAGPAADPGPPTEPDPAPALYGDVSVPPEELPPRGPAGLWRRLNAEGEAPDPITFWGRSAVLALFTLWGLAFIAAPLDPQYFGSSFWHLVNLVFHEAGHYVFIFLGDFMRVLGGTLMQVLIPAVCTGAFLWHRNPFGAAVGLWWTGQSLMDAAPYIADARALELTLLGGATGKAAPQCHDWRNLLGRLHLLESDRTIAWVFFGAGTAVMLLGIVWGTWILLRQYAVLRAAQEADRRARTR